MAIRKLINTFNHITETLKIHFWTCVMERSLIRLTQLHLLDTGPIYKES